VKEKVKGKKKKILPNTPRRHNPTKIKIKKDEGDRKIEKKKEKEGRENTKKDKEKKKKGGEKKKAQPEQKKRKR